MIPALLFKLETQRCAGQVRPSVILYLEAYPERRDPALVPETRQDDLENPGLPRDLAFGVDGDEGVAQDGLVERLQLVKVVVVLEHSIFLRNFYEQNILCNIHKQNTLSIKQNTLSIKQKQNILFNKQEQNILFNKQKLNILFNKQKQNILYNKQSKIYCAISKVQWTKEKYNKQKQN